MRARITIFIMGLLRTALAPLRIYEVLVAFFSTLYVDFCVVEGLPKHVLFAFGKGE